MLQASFSGIPLSGTASFTMCQGPTPSTGTISIRGRASLPSKGHLFLSDGKNSISIGPLYFTNPVVSYSDQGRELRATLVDRRVLWRGSWVYGTFNKIEAAGAYHTILNLRQLFALCFRAFNLRPTLFRIPDAAPAVKWEFMNPAAAIQDLCERFGLTVGLSVQGVPYICPANYGRRWPKGSHQVIEHGETHRYYPGGLRILGRRIIEEKTCVDLDAVGLETDGRVRKINDLSYKPLGGWGKSIIMLFSDVADKDKRALAEKCIYKWYGYTPATGQLKRWYLPWLNKLAAVKLLPDGSYEHTTPFVTCIKAVWDGLSWVILPSTRMNAGFSVDGVRGIVVFDEPVCNMSEGYEGKEAEQAYVSIRVAFEHDSDSQNDFYHHDTSLGGQGPWVIHRDDSLQLYKADGSDLNKTTLDAYCQKLSASLRQSLVPGNSRTEAREYVGIIPVEVYGVFKSATWTITEQGAFTSIHAGQELVRPTLPMYEERLSAHRIYTVWSWRANHQFLCKDVDGGRA